MADHPDMTDAELATAVQVYLDTGSYTAAAQLAAHVAMLAAMREAA